MNARHPRGVEGDVRHGASGVDIDGGGRPTLECLQPSLDLGRSNNASVNSRVVQARKALAIGRRQAVALTDGGGKIAPARATETLGDVPPPVRRPVVQSPARARPPPPPSALPARQGNTAIGGTNFRKMLDARKAEAAVSDARMSAALHAAVKTGDPGAVQRLIDSGASVNTADDAGRTPLLHASSSQVVSVLVAAGARYTETTRGGTARVRQLELGEVEGGLGVYTVDIPELEPESELKLPQMPIASEVSQLLERAVLQEKVATTLPGSSTTAERVASLVGASIAPTPLSPVSLRLPGELAKMSVRGRDELREAVLLSTGLKQSDVAQISLQAGSIIATVHFKATATAAARDALQQKIASGSLHVTMPDGSVATAVSVAVGSQDAKNVCPQLAAAAQAFASAGGNHATRSASAVANGVLQPHEVMKLRRAGLPVPLPSSLGEQGGDSSDGSATDPAAAKKQEHRQSDKAKKKSRAFVGWGKIRSQVQSVQQQGGPFFVDTRAQEEQKSIASAAFSGTRGVSQALAEAAMGGADGALELAEANLMHGWEQMRAVRFAEVAVSRRLNRRAACRERCRCCCSGLTRVVALSFAYLLWLGGGIIGLHWWFYCGSRCLQHFCRYTRHVPPRLRYWYARRCQPEPVMPVGSDVNEGEQLESGDTAASMKQKYAIEGEKMGRTYPQSASAEEKDKEKDMEVKGRQRTVLEQGTYVAGLGVVDSAAAARVAVAHTLATLGSGRFRSEGWGEDAERGTDDVSTTRTKNKRRKQLIGHAPQPKPDRFKCLTKRCSCGSGPGAVALHHGMVYLLGWWLVCGIRLHFLPQVAPCYDYDPRPQLPFCPSLSFYADENETETRAIFLQNETTAVVTAVVSPEWTRSPPALLGDDLLSPINSKLGA